MSAMPSTASCICRGGAPSDCAVSSTFTRPSVAFAMSSKYLTKPSAMMKCVAGIQLL
jgi:hypothetical protein